MTETFNPENKRWCAYAEAGINDPEHPDRHMVAYVVEGERGYRSTTYTGDLDYCKKVAESINESLNVSADDARDIVSSSMAAQNRG